MKTLEPGFEKADSNNLPMVDEFMLAVFFNSASFLSPETRNVKTLRSARANYSENAIGYVQVKRAGDSVCEIRAEITPETRVNAESYAVYAIIDEKTDNILVAKCGSRRAQNDGCKHAIAFVSWLWRKSNEPAVTSTTCYWKQSTLHSVGSSKTAVPINEIKIQMQASVPKENTKACFNEILGVLKKTAPNITVVNHTQVKRSLSLFHLMLQYKEMKEIERHSADDFIDFCSSVMTDKECGQLANKTKQQSHSSLWFNLRYGRVSASKVYESSRCQTPEGSLVYGILGVVKVKETKAIKRGRELEREVLQVVKNNFKRPILRTGFVMKRQHPIFGASPDGLLDDYVVEVKCPSTEKTFPTYFTEDMKEPSNKYKGQMMLQMYACNKSKGLFAVTDPLFEENKIVTVIVVDFDKNFTDSMMDAAQEFWKSNIYPILYNNV